MNVEQMIVQLGAKLDKWLDGLHPVRLTAS